MMPYRTAARLPASERDADPIVVEWRSVSPFVHAWTIASALAIVIGVLVLQPELVAGGLVAALFMRACVALFIRRVRLVVCSRGRFLRVEHLGLRRVVRAHVDSPQLGNVLLRRTFGSPARPEAGWEIALTLRDGAPITLSSQPMQSSYSLRATARRIAERLRLPEPSFD